MNVINKTVALIYIITSTLHQKYKIIPVIDKSLLQYVFIVGTKGAIVLTLLYILVDRIELSQYGIPNTVTRLVVSGTGFIATHYAFKLAGYAK